MDTRFNPLNDPPAHVAGDRATHGRKLSDVAQRSSINFKSAAATTMPFGKHHGESLEQIAVDDEGLKYLDYMRGTLEADKTELLEAICRYLDEPVIERELKAVLNGGRD